MTITLYELVAQQDRRLSPFCWRSRMALQHKGLDATIKAVGYAEKEKLTFSGQGEPAGSGGSRLARLPSVTRW